ncbi:MAG: HAMP domain-containing sensor histidine kinase [Gallionellaceae bacterium]|nr:HAMP domain-containing sensor histidine kinase [Gallionellaceae bacterium]
MPRSAPPPLAAPIPITGLASHPGVLINLLDALAGAGGLSEEARTWLLLDPALALEVLRLSAQHGAAPGQYDFAELCERVSLTTLKGLASDAAIRQLANPATAIEDADWSRAISLAYLCRALARESDYPALDEAWLAGLFCALPGSQAALSELPIRGFLADVPRFLREPANRLRDATPLPRLAAMAWRLLEKRTPADLDTLSLPPSPDHASLRAILQEMDKSVEVFSALARAQQDLSGAVARFTRAELATTGMHERNCDGVLAAARLLAEQEGLYDPLYLRLDKRTSMLESQDLGEFHAPPISIRMEGGNSAAVRALFTRALVVVYTDAGGDASLLDMQLARQADADGVAAIPVGEGDTRGVLLVCGDRKALADVAAHAERYTRMGELTARAIPAAAPPPDAGDAYLGGRVRRAAHEINNPLGIIKNYLAILKAKLGDAAPIADELRIIHEELDRIVRIVRALTNDDDSLAELSEDTDIGQLVEDLVKVTAPTWQARGIQVTHKPGAALPRLNCDRDKLKQVLLNLLLNALEATPDGGEIRLETARITNQKRERFIELQISDSGPGISPEVADKLFAPLETEKGEDHAGLGLAIVNKLMEDLGATISFKTGSSGTSFQLLFPLG